jgi:dihydrofolate reductase
MPKHLDIIIASGSQGCFGNKGKLPWKRIVKDMEFFKEMT